MPFLSKSRIFLIFCLSFIAGVLMAPLMSKIIMVIAAMIFIMLASIWYSNKLVRVIGFAGLILLLGSLRFDYSIQKNNLSQYYGRNVQMQGVVVEEPDVRDDKIYLTMGHLVYNDQQINDRVLVSVYTSRNYAYGDKLDLIGKLQEPAVFDDFNYKNYLSRFGVHAVMYYPTNQVVASNQGNIIKADLLKIKDNFAQKLSLVLPEPQNAFLGGLLFGAKHSIPQAITDQFAATGTSHIVAISGYNITIIIWAMEKLLLSRFGRRTSSLACIVVIVCFVVLTGASGSVIRAAVMGGLVLVARNIGRLENMTNLMAVTAMVMIAINPQILLYDVGFQLSFIALAGLVYLSPHINKPFARLPKILREPLVATLSAQIFALPILLLNFDQLSLVAPLANVLVLEIVPPTMLFGFLTGIFGFIWPPFSAIFAWPTWMLLSYILKAVELTSQIPYASIALHLNLPAVISYYAALINILVWVDLVEKNNKPLAPLLQPVVYKD